MFYISIKYWIFLLYNFIFSFTVLYASNDNYPSGARNAGMGNVGVMCSDLWSVSYNQAGLGFYNHFTAGFYHENRFAVPEFSLHSVAFSFPTGTGTFGLNCSYFGYSAYHESKIGLGFGKSLNEKFSAGIQFNYLNTYVAEVTGNMNSFAIEAGILTRPVKNLYVGFHIYNLTGSTFSSLTEKEHIPVIIRLGIGYNFKEKLFIGIETEKDIEMDPAFFKAGIEYRILQNIYARSGVMVSGYISHAFGIGFNMKRIKADLALSHQQIIGYTPSFAIQYNIK